MDQLEQYLKAILNFSSDDLNALTECFNEVSLKKASYLAKEGEFSSKFGFIINGTMRAFYRNSNGVEYNKTFFTESNFVGAYSSLVSGNKNLINIQCLTDCKVLIASYKSLTNLYNEHPKIERMSRLISEQFFVNKEKREIELVMLDASERYEIFKKEHPGLANKIPQYHIASYLGITPTQLSRIRASL